MMEGICMLMILEVPKDWLYRFKINQSVIQLLKKEALWIIKDYSTQGSQVVTNLTTNWALPVLTS